MPQKFTVGRNVSAGNRNFNGQLSIDCDTIAVNEKTIPAAKTGTLAVRTDNNTGSLTMANGHGITTGARLDVYWAGGSRRGMTVGTVATNTVPIDGGSGDNLPVITTPITAMVPVEEPLVFTGDNVQAYAAYSSVVGTIVLATAANAEAHFFSAKAVDQADAWTVQDGTTNPFAGDAVTKVFYSHSDSGASRTMRVAVGY